MTTKSSQIMLLHAQGLSTRQIACQVYQLSSEAPHKAVASAMAYVRIVTKQRKGKGLSSADVAWRSANAEKRAAQNARHFQRIWADPVKRQQFIAYQVARRRQRREEDPVYREKARAQWRNDYYKRVANHL